MPVNARIALPFFLAMMVWAIFVVVGVVKQGPLKYLKNTGFPPGVPWPLYFLVTPIELVSTFIVRPLSMFVRLFANMLAGHLLLISFAVICAALWSLTIVAGHPAVLVRPARRAHRVRDPGGLPAGLHLHHSRCRVHR